jgi:hypothetical protein
VVDLAVAVEEAAVADAAAVVVDDAGNRTINDNKTIKTKFNTMTRSKIFASAILLFGCTTFAWSATPAAKPDAATAGQPKQKEFDSPKQAADALLQATESFDVAALKETLGPDCEDIVSSPDQVGDKNRALAFAAEGKEKTSIEIDKKNPNIAILVVGNDSFPLPIPIVKHKAKWIFDTKIGRQEILNRRIGSNELDVIGICRGFVEAQHEYAMEKHDDSEVNQYAQKLISTPGKHDGLAWQEADGTWAGPVGQPVAVALEQGYTADKSKPFHGYFFKVLKGQGKDAPMGEMDFVVEGAMIGGFALAAAPAEYRVTGVMTFIIGPDGVVYQKDLGKDTLKTFQSMDRYNPDKSWHPTQDEWRESDEPASAATNN